MAGRYFVTIRASDEQLFRRLLDYDLDLFATRRHEDRYEVDGLIRLVDLARLVDDGYQVLVTESDRPRRERPPVARAEEWLRDAEAEIEPRRGKGRG